MLGQDSHYDLPILIWQDNSQEQTWSSQLTKFGSDDKETLSLALTNKSLITTMAKMTSNVTVKLPYFQDRFICWKGKQYLR